MLNNSFIHSDANIWSKSKEKQMDLHQQFSAHEKQFAYLPLAILDSATNIRQLFSHIENEKKLDDLVQKIHTQMPTKRWPPELSKLRFIDTTSDKSANEAVVAKPRTTRSASMTVANPKSRTTGSASMKATAMEKTSNIEPAKKRPATNPINSRQLRKRKVK